MNRTSFKILALAAATSATFAASGARAADAVPSMKFVATMAAPARGTPQRSITQSRSGDRMVVVVQEPAACGERPAAPSFDIDGQRLTIRYRVAAPAKAGPGACFATAIASFHDLPSGELKVVAVAEAPADAGRLALAH
jgi:hypothetical protein